MKADALELEVHTNINRDFVVSATNDEILDALKKVIDIPENILRLQLSLSVDSPPEITFVKIAEKIKVNL